MFSLYDIFDGMKPHLGDELLCDIHFSDLFGSVTFLRRVGQDCFKCVMRMSFLAQILNARQVVVQCCLPTVCIHLPKVSLSGGPNWNPFLGHTRGTHCMLLAGMPWALPDLPKKGEMATRTDHWLDRMEGGSVGRLRPERIGSHQGRAGGQEGRLCDHARARAPCAPQSRQQHQQPSSEPKVELCRP